MKKLIVIVIILFGILTIGVKTQTQVGIFGWESLTNPPFPTTDSVTLTASTDVFTQIPVIPGYNNQNSLEINITYGNTGYCFITNSFPEPITIPQYCQFIVKSTNGQNFCISPFIQYQGSWYTAINGSDNLSNNWYRITSSDWYGINGEGPYPNDSIVIENCIFYIHNYSNSLTLTLDTWFHPNSGGTPILYCGFGDQLSGLENIDFQIASNYSLLQNYPNPFNPSTKIQFTVPTTSDINLDIYNVLGQKVATLVNEELATGTYEYEFNATNLPSGNYFYTLTSGEQKLTKKMVFLK
jgi:hypothetical protein